jgi:hypothetical protein
LDSSKFQQAYWFFARVTDSQLGTSLQQFAPKTPFLSKSLPHSLLAARFEKYCSHSARGFLGFGKASTKDHSIRSAVHLFYCAVCQSAL